MSRRNRAPKRDILPDPKFKSQVVAKFVNHIMLDGKSLLQRRLYMVRLIRLKLKMLLLMKLKFLRRL